MAGWQLKIRLLKFNVHQSPIAVGLLWQQLLSCRKSVIQFVIKADYTNVMKLEASGV